MLPQYYEWLWIQYVCSALIIHVTACVISPNYSIVHISSLTLSVAIPAAGSSWGEGRSLRGCQGSVPGSVGWTMASGCWGTLDRALCLQWPSLCPCVHGWTPGHRCCVPAGDCVVCWALQLMIAGPVLFPVERDGQSKTECVCVGGWVYEWQYACSSDRELPVHQHLPPVTRV